jgi:hypothetical protein
MTNTHWPSTHHGEPLPVPGDGSGPFELIAMQVADSGTSIDVELEIAGIRQQVRGRGSDRIAAFADAAVRAGVRVAMPHRQVHDWDGATGTVTAYVWCLIDGAEVSGAGVARERGEATMRAMLGAAGAALHAHAPLLHT